MFSEYAIRKDETSKRILEEIGVFSRTKLEKLADSFSGVKSSIYPDKENPNEGSVEFIYTSHRIFQKSKQEIKNIANKFYNEDNYLICVSTSDNGFNIIITKNFINGIFNKQFN